MVVEATVKLSPMYAVPLAELRLEPCESLNRELEALFLAREDDEHRNPTPSHIPQQELYESRFNLFHWPESCVRELRQFMLDGVARTVMAAGPVIFENTSVLPFNVAGAAVKLVFSKLKDSTDGLPLPNG